MSPLGLKIAMTGLLFVVACAVTLGAMGERTPPVWVQWPIILALFGGMVAAFVGLLIGIWG